MSWLLSLENSVKNNFIPKLDNNGKNEWIEICSDFLLSKDAADNYHLHIQYPQQNFGAWAGAIDFVSEFFECSHLILPAGLRSSHQWTLNSTVTGTGLKQEKMVPQLLKIQSCGWQDQILTTAAWHSFDQFWHQVSIANFLHHKKHHSCPNQMDRNRFSLSTWWRSRHQQMQHGPCKSTCRLISIIPTVWPNPSSFME